MDSQTLHLWYWIIFVTVFFWLPLIFGEDVANWWDNFRNHRR